MSPESGPRPDERPPAGDTPVDDGALAEEERERKLARDLSVANDLDTGPPRHDQA